MNSSSNGTIGDEQDVGAPLPSFNAANIQLTTIAPALGVSVKDAQKQGALQQQQQINPYYQQPDYLDYDPKGRGTMTTMFANAGVSYLMGISVGGIYGAQRGLQVSPSARFRVQLNSVLNNSGRYGSKVSNMTGIFAVFYSLYEGLADNYELDEIVRAPPSMAAMVSPTFAATAAAATYFAPSGPRVATLAGALGFGSVAITYSMYSLLGIPHGSQGFLFF
jgi:mitochondrial import inner membrane translocase subunit TIM23